MRVKRSSGLKILLIYKILMEKTDENHPITANEIIAELEHQSEKISNQAFCLNAERKSVYADIELLKQFGVDVIAKRGMGYFIGKRDFQLPELKLLVDAVQSSRMMTEKKSKELIEKLTRLTSFEQGKQLTQQASVIYRTKMANELIYYIVDKIHEAIQNKKKIQFRYFMYDARKEKKLRHGGTFYIQTPLALCWDEDNYYMIAYSEKYDNITHYRIDRMQDVYISDEAAAAVDAERFHLRDLSKRVFSMFGGEKKTVTLRFHNDLANVVIDQFGLDVRLAPDGPNHFQIIREVEVSPVFFAWVFQLGGKAEILKPESVREAMLSALRNAIDVMTSRDT